MSQNKQPEDLNALEEYYRRQLLEYSRRASVPQPDVSPAAKTSASVKPEAEQTADAPDKPPVSPKSDTAGSAEVHAEKSPNQPKHAEAAPQPVISRQVQQAESGQEKAQSSFRKTGESFPGAGVLPRTPKVLRTASVVQPLPGSGDTGIGRIKARVTTGSGAVPIEGAIVLIERMDGDTLQLVDQLVTDGSGNTPVSQALPTAPVSQSLSPGLDATPYAVYQVRIRAKGFAEYVAKNVLVFDGELSLVDANMLPQRENLQQNGEVRDA